MPRTTGNIVQNGANVLRMKASPLPITEIRTKRVKDIIKRMSKELAAQDDGVAIAAPQVGEPLALFVISKKMFARKKDGSLPEGDEDHKDLIIPTEDSVFINPRITKLSKKRRWVPEGCLSVRWHYGEALRSEKATIEAYDGEGKKFTRGGSGLLAQIFQHETDHLDGILFTDHARKIEKILPEDKEQRLERSGRKAR